MRSYHPTRWSILVGCLLLVSITGAVYGFGLISDSIKDRLNISQTQLDFIATMGNAGIYFSIIPGQFNNYYGPTRSIWIGSVFMIFGWLAFTAVITQFLYIGPPNTAYLILAFINFFYSHGNAWVGQISPACIVQNFPKSDHGKVLGLAKGYSGISTAFLSIWMTDLANENIDTFMILMLAFFPLTYISFAFFFKVLPARISNQYTEKEMGYKYCFSPKYQNIQKQMIINDEFPTVLIANENSSKINKSANFSPWFFCSFLLAIYLMIAQLIQNFVKVPIYIRIAIFLICFIIWLLPWLLIKIFHGSFFMIVAESDTKLLLNNVMIDTAEERNVGFWGMVRTKEFYLLYLIFFLLSGCGLMYMNNISQIIESASLTSLSNTDTNEYSSITTTMVTFISVGNFSGRMCAGYLSDYYSNKFHRIFWSMIAAVFFILTYIYLLMIEDHVHLFYVGSFFIGFSFGIMFLICIATVSDLWGTKYLSGNYATVDSAPIFSSFAFSTGVFGYFYTEQGKYRENDGDKCYGVECFRRSFICALCSAIFALILSFVLWRTLTLKMKKIQAANH